jgi:hypothetical protein
MSSILRGVTIGIDNGNASIMHRLRQVGESSRIDLFPCFLQNPELVCGVSGLALANRPIENLPEVLNRVQVGRLGRPLQNPDAVLGEPRSRRLRCVLRIVVLLVFPSSRTMRVSPGLHSLIHDPQVLGRIHNAFDPMKGPDSPSDETSPHHYTSTTMLHSGGHVLAGVSCVDGTADPLDSVGEEFELRLVGP